MGGERSWNKLSATSNPWAKWTVLKREHLTPLSWHGDDAGIPVRMAVCRRTLLAPIEYTYICESVKTVCPNDLSSGRLPSVRASMRDACFS